MRNLNIGLIGYGYWGEILLKTIQKIPGFQVISVCDRNKKKLNQLQLKNKNILTTTSTIDIVNHKNIDAVIISTPPNTHYEITKKALLSNKHVLVEKPITQKKSQAKYLAELASKKKLILMVDHTYLYSPEIRVAKKIIDRGEIGTMRFIEMLRVGPKQYKNYTDVIWDFTPHDISILYYLNGSPVKTRAVTYDNLQKNKSDVSSLFFNFKNGASAFIYSSWLSPIKTRKILIIGSKKSIFIEQSGVRSKIYLYSNTHYLRNNQQLDIEPYRIKNIKSSSGLTYTEPLKNVVAKFGQAIFTKKQPISDGFFGLKIIDTIEEVISSQKLIT